MMDLDQIADDEPVREESEVHPPDAECPTCEAWVGWACKGPGYGYHAAGYHSARHKEARRKLIAKVAAKRRGDG